VHGSDPFQGDVETSDIVSEQAVDRHLVERVVSEVITMGSGVRC